MKLPALQRRLAPILRPVATLYGAAMRIRASRYASGNAMRVYRAACPVISVGNISWGGTGKTPLVSYLLRAAEAMSLSAVVLTRGYKARPPKLPYRVAIDDDPAVAGDEPLLLARDHPEATVIVDPKRGRAAAWAEANGSPGLFILDDGMQHLAMARDCDIVLLTPDDLLDGWNRVIPSGTWRENALALSRAHAFCIKTDAATFSGIVPVAAQRLAAFGRPLFSFTLRPTGLTRLSPYGNASREAAERLGDTAYTLLTGTGNPAQVRDTATALLGKAPAYEHLLPDHHAFTHEDAAKAAAHGKPILCTAKDAVKLSRFLPAFGEVPVWVITVRAVFGPALFTNQDFDAWWLEQWRAFESRGSA